MVNRKKLSLIAKTLCGIFFCKEIICPFTIDTVFCSAVNFISPSSNCKLICPFPVWVFNSALACKPSTTMVILSDLKTVMELRSLSVHVVSCFNSAINLFRSISTKGAFNTRSPSGRSSVASFDLFLLFFIFDHRSSL